MERNSMISLCHTCDCTAILLLHTMQVDRIWDTNLYRYNKKSPKIVTLMGVCSCPSTKNISENIVSYLQRCCPSIACVLLFLFAIWFILLLFIYEWIDLTSEQHSSPLELIIQIDSNCPTSYDFAEVGIQVHEV